MRMKFTQSLLIALLLALTSIVTMAQQRPLITEDVETVKQGSARIEFGFDFQQDRDFTLSGLNADLTRLGVVMIRIGLGPNIEFENGGVIQNFISINRQFRPSGVPLELNGGANSSHDWGDFYLATKFRLRPETKRVPGIGFRFAVELPNSNQSRGIGLNQMNFYSTLIAGKHFGKFNVFGNIGLGILTAPLDRFTQNDVLLYGIAGAYEMSERLTLVGEIQGRYSSRKNTPVGTESDGAARFGARIRAAGLMWDVSGQAGLYKHSARTGLSFGVSYESPILNPVK